MLWGEPVTTRKSFFGISRRQSPSSAASPMRGKPLLVVRRGEMSVEVFGRKFARRRSGRQSRKATWRSPRRRSNSGSRNLRNVRRRYDCWSGTGRCRRCTTRAGTSTGSTSLGYTIASGGGASDRPRGILKVFGEFFRKILCVCCSCMCVFAIFPSMFFFHSIFESFCFFFWSQRSF